MLVSLFLGCSLGVSIYNVLYMYTKEQQLFLDFEQKLQEKNYKKTEEELNLYALLARQVIPQEKYMVRVLFSFLPLINLYPFGQILSKKLAREYDTILTCLDRQEVLEELEKQNYIYNQETILKRKKQLEEEHPSFLKESETASLEILYEKKKILEEIIVLKKQDDFEMKKTLSLKGEEPHQYYKKK